MIRVVAPVSSISATALSFIEPRPVLYASRMPWRPRICAPVGKSGPLTNCMSSSDVASGCSSMCVDGVGHLTEIVRGDVRRHSDRDSLRAVHE